MRSILRWAATGVLVAVASVLLAAPASAHPSDEVVQQVYLTPAASGLTIRLDLTPGVLVAPQFTGAIDTDGNGTLSPSEVDAHVAAVRSAVTAQVDGAPVDLGLSRHGYPPVDLLAAAGGTISLEWTAPLPANVHQVVVIDRYEPGARSTVQMSVLVPPDPVPLGRIAHADEGRSMAVALNPGTGPAPADPASAQNPAAASTMLDALRRPLTSPWTLLVLVGASCLLGALHALTPGHGKTLLAAYLVGDKGTPRQAVALGGIITFTHTAAVFALGGAVLAASRWVVPGVVVPVVTVVAGVVVLALGLRLVRRRWAGRAGVEHDHDHGHSHGDGHGDGHDHGHGDGHGHGHVVRTRPAGLHGIAAMGASAGIIPCPEALSVLLLAVGLNRTGLGLVMIVAFSMGLAAVLVGLGLLLVTAAPVVARFAGRRSAWVTTRLPLLSAAVVTVLGGAMAVTGVTGLAG